MTSEAKSEEKREPRHHSVELKETIVLSEGFRIRSKRRTVKHVNLEEKGVGKEGLGRKIFVGKRKIVDHRESGGVAKRFSYPRDGGAPIQIVWVDGVIHHLDCKKCENQYKREFEGSDYSSKFIVSNDQHLITCLSCGYIQDITGK